MKARKTALLGILCAQAIALSFLESLIPCRFCRPERSRDFQI